MKDRDYEYFRLKEVRRITLNPDKKLLIASETALRQCLGQKENERVLIVVNPPQQSIGSALFDKAQELSEDVRLICYPVGNINGEEPPKWVGDSMMEADIVIAATVKSISHTDARRRASREKGARIASMPGITEDIFIRGMNADYEEIGNLSRSLQIWFDKSKSARITSPSGTDLRITLGNRSSVSTGRMLEKGEFSNLPDGETECAPVSAEGRLVVDRCGDIITEATEMMFEKGHIVRIQDSDSGRRFRSLLEDARKTDGNENASFIAEFAIGTNRGAKVSGVILEDEKVYGTCHIAVGDNTSYDGGENPSVLHIDMIVFKPSIWFDDTCVMKDGELCV